MRIDPEKPAILRREHSPKTTKESYEFLAGVKKHHGVLPGPRISIVGSTWVELTFDKKLDLASDKLEELIGNLRGILTEGQVSIDAEAIKFQKGQHLMDWIAEARTEINKDEVEQ